MKSSNQEVDLKELKANLFFLFEPFGRVIEIVVVRRNSMRGQAFVVFKARQEAELALKTLQGFKIFDKPLNIAFARKQSYAYIVEQGKFVYKNYREKYEQRKAEVFNTLTSEGQVDGRSDLQQKSHGQGMDQSQTANTILLVENIPDNMSDDLFRFLFKQFPGLKHTKVFKEKRLGFAEFLSQGQAAVALKATNGFVIRENMVLKVSYAQQGPAQNGSGPSN